MATDYRVKLASLEDWDAYLLAESRLPGPRANLELAHIAAEAAEPERIDHWLSYDAKIAPTNTPEEFLFVCGVLGLGRLLAAGDTGQLGRLRVYASDPRWRTREAAAMALQTYGRVDMDGLVAEMQIWCQGTYLEQRASAAALCEPGLLTERVINKRVLDILDSITFSISEVTERKNPDFKAILKGMGYCWSVAVVACPDPGKSRMERWLDNQNPDIRWIMKQNLKKKRLQRLDADWVSHSLTLFNS